MVTVEVCVGSSCHMKGSYQVINTYKQLIEQNELEEYVKLKASFCLGCCLNGIATRVNGEPVNGLGFANAEQMFYEHIYPKAKEEKERGEAQ